MLRALLNQLSLALPSQCVVCGDWPAEALCAACLARFDQRLARCPTCALPLPAGHRSCGACLREPPPLQRCLAAVPYDYPWNSLIARYKFGADPGWARALAALMRRADGAQQALQEAELVLPIPLSTQRLRQRGFNQALELARHLAPRKTRADVLLRLHDTPAQSALPRAQRLRNLRGAFATAPGRGEALRGRRVLLIDDVMTTGATLHTAALALQAAGAAAVQALVLARTAEA
jgi:ComF family protein